MTKRFPASEVVQDLCDRAVIDVGRINQLWPFVQEHSRRGGVRFPVGNDGGGHAEGVHSDPTSSAVLASLDRPTEPEVLDRRAMLEALNALYWVDRARRSLEHQIEAMAAALGQGRSPTDGRTMAEVVAMREHRRAIPGDIDCVICHEPTHRRISGMDPACFAAWGRAGRPDRGDWGRSRRSWLEKQKEIDRQNAELVDSWENDRHVSSGPADGIDRRVV